jgi:PAS domain S-box-containing protein
MPGSTFDRSSKDIGEHEAERALRDSERRLQLAFEVAQMGVAEYDLHTGRVVFSDNLIRLLGHEPDSAPHTLDWFFSHVHPDDQNIVRNVIERVTAGEAVDEVHYRIARRDGAVRWWAGQARVVCESEGHPWRVLGVCTDITDRKSLEEQVRQSLKLEAIGQLAGGIAHDFNNLLTVITGYAETLLAAVDPADANFADIVEIRRAAERAAVLTQQLLAFSRKQVLRPTLVDANEIVRDISGMIARLIGGNIELTVHGGHAPMTVLADRGQMEQVLLNLAVNARDAMPGGGRLEMSTRVADVPESEALHLYPMRPGRYVLLSVRDTGVGMSPEVRARAFEPFFTTKPVGEGTGIGLSTVYGIVKQSGGFIFVDSEPGQGTRFDVYLPLATATADARARSAGDASRAARTILLVEDYRRVRELARKVLTRQGYRVLAAASGDEALEIVRAYSGSVDVIVTDVVMPGLSGPELVARVQELRPGIPVLYISGDARGALSVQGLEDEGVAFLQKPFTPAALAQKVGELARRSVQTARGA